MKLSITANWTVLPLARGTVDNTSGYNVEIAKTDANDGIIIYPKQRFAFSGAMKVRAMNGIANTQPVKISVVDFIDSSASGGIDMDNPDDMVTSSEAEDLANEILGK